MLCSEGQPKKGSNKVGHVSFIFCVKPQIRGDTRRMGQNGRMRTIAVYRPMKMK